MNCEKCGYEMLVVKLSAFYTHYVCPVCEHEIYYAPLDDNEEPTDDDELVGDVDGWGDEL